MLVDTNTNSFFVNKWNENYKNLKIYFKDYNKLPLQDHEEILKDWVNAQKKSFKKNTLSQERIDLLLNITPDFFEKNVKNWKIRYEELKIYFQEHKKLPTKKENGLGRWVDSQKSSIKKNTLSDRKAHLLLKITMEFLENKNFVWNEHYQSLKIYFKDHNKLPTKKGALSGWVDSQKSSFKKNTLSQERIDLLLIITPDFFDRNQIEITWQIKYNELKNYFKDHNKLPPYKSGSLSIWSNRQKTNFNKNTLSQERIDLLLIITPIFFEKKKSNR
jgi:hypothetical protein